MIRQSRPPITRRQKGEIPRLAWTPDATQKGSITVTVRVSDGRGGTDEQTFTVSVSEVISPVVKPGIAITSPAGGTTADKKFRVAGTASQGTAALQRVEVRLDNGTWQVAAGVANWSYEFDTTRLAAGRHTVEARAFDGTNYSPTATVVFVVEKRAKPVAEGGFPLWIPVVLIAVVVGGVAAAVFAMRRRGGGAQPAQPQPPPPPQAPPTKL